MSKLKLDGQLRSALGVRSPGFDDLRIYGLTGGQIKQDMGNFNGPAQPNLRDHIKGKVIPNQIHKYAEPRIIGETFDDGISRWKYVATDKVLKNKPYSSGVYFPTEEETVIEAGVTGLPGEEYSVLSPERWDGNRVNMNGTQRSRNHGGFRGKRARKVWTAK